MFFSWEVVEDYGAVLAVDEGFVELGVAAVLDVVGGVGGGGGFLGGGVDEGDVEVLDKLAIFLITEFRRILLLVHQLHGQTSNSVFLLLHHYFQIIQIFLGLLQIHLLQLIQLQHHLILLFQFFVT